MPDDQDNPEAELRAAKPLHCIASDGTVKVIRRTGRPKKVYNRPTIDERVYAEQLVAIAERFVATDALVQSATKEHARDDLEVIDEAMLQLAREAASLKFEELKLLGEARDFSQASSRRTDALSQIARLVIERERLALDKTLDPRNPEVQKVVSSFLDAMRECADETLGPDAERFLANFRKRLEGWEDRVQQI